MHTEVDSEPVRCGLPVGALHDAHPRTSSRPLGCRSARPPDHSSHLSRYAPGRPSRTLWIREAHVSGARCVGRASRRLRGRERDLALDPAEPRFDDDGPAVQPTRCDLGDDSRLRRLRHAGHAAPERGIRNDLRGQLYIDIHSDYASLPEHEEKFVRPYAGEIDGSNLQLTHLRVSNEHMARCRASPSEPCLDIAGDPLVDPRFEAQGAPSAKLARFRRVIRPPCASRVAAGL
jgi:hypothetical protein